MRHDAGGFNYDIGDSRIFATRSPVEGSGGMSYTYNLPAPAASDGGSGYAYVPAPKAYGAMPAYGTPYGSEEFGFGLGLPVPCLPLMSQSQQEPVGGMLPTQQQWTSGPRAAAEYPVASDPALHSLYPGVAVAAPPPVPRPDRLLPTPAMHSPTLPYPLALRPAPSTYGGSFTTAGMSYSPPTVNTSSASPATLSSSPSTTTSPSTSPTTSTSTSSTNPFVKTEEGSHSLKSQEDNSRSPLLNLSLAPPAPDLAQPSPRRGSPYLCGTTAATAVMVPSSPVPHRHRHHHHHHHHHGEASVKSEDQHGAVSVPLAGVGVGVTAGSGWIAG